MSKLSLREIAQSQLDSTPVIDGQLIVCLDTGNAYRDTATAHVKIGSDLEVVSDLPLAPLAEKLYYLKPDKLYVFLGGNWTLLNDKTIDLDESIAKLPAGSSTVLNDDVEIITQDTDITQPHYYRRKLVVLWEYIKTKAQDFFAAKNHKHGKADITDFPTSMPASDVYPWAKAATKPSYTKAEVGMGKVDNTADADKTVKRATTAGTADSANSVAWKNVKDKPTTFPVEAHNHDDRYYTEAEMDGKLDSKVNNNEAGANGLLSKLSVWTANPTDDTYFMRQDTDGTNQFGRVKFSTIWNYIRGKADGVYQPKGSYSTTDTKNTAGSTNTTSKLYLIGATSQSTNPQTYSNAGVYTTGSTIYANGFGNDIFIIYPSGGVARYGGQVIGYCKITLPTLWDSTMMTFTVTIYNYVSNTSVDYRISGYNYSGKPWYNCAAVCIGKAGMSHSNLSVRFGDNGTKNVITIGEEDTEWEYPKIVVHDVVIGNSNFETYKSGWNVEISKSGAPNVSETISNTHVGYNAVTSWDKIQNKPSSFTPASHTHTKDQVGLSNVDNTADKDKNVATARGISVSDPILAVGAENSEITGKTNSNKSLGATAANAGIYGLINALDFRWYDTHWQIGNLRSGSTPSAGFGFAFKDEGENSFSLKARILTDGTYTGNISGNAATASTADTANTLSGFYPALSQGWGVQTGTFVHGEDDSTGGSFAFRRDCPTGGQMSMVLDGRFYQNEGQYRVLDTSDEPNLNVNSANFAKETYINQYKTVNLTDLDQNTWYPVTSTYIPYKGLRRFKCNVQLNSGSRPSWSTHGGGFTAVVDILEESSGWGTTTMQGMVLVNDQYWINDSNKPPVGYSQLRNSSIAVWWLRGGGTYFLAADYDCTWTIQKSKYEINGQSVAPTTTYPGVSVRRSTIVANLDGHANTSEVATVGVRDYNDANRTIKIGFAGDGLNTSNLNYIAGYTDNGTKIKDVSKGVLTSWIGLGNYLPLGGGTMSGALNFANGTWNRVGDDAYMGDHNIAGSFCIIGANDTTRLALVNKDNQSDYALVEYGGGNLNFNKKLGANITGHADGDLSLGGGTINGDIEFSNCGTGIRQILFTCADNDYGRVAVGGTASNAGYMEIATGDDGTEPIYARQYSGLYASIVRSATLLDKNGNTSFPGAVTANTYYAPNWFRATGDSGFYFESHGGGWYMSDDTWIRAYNSKNIYTPGVIQCDGGFNGNLNGHASSDLALSGGTMSGQITKSTGGSWIGDRDRAAIKSSYAGDSAYGAVAAMATKNGFWTIGNLGGDERLIFNYSTDSNYSAGNNSTSQVYLPAQAGTIITSATIGDQTVNRAKYLGNDSAYMRMHWNGQSGQPTWLWGGNDASNMYVWNPSNFSVNYANSAGSAGSATSASNGVTASGSNYVRFGDGTQICWGNTSSINNSGTSSHTFPAAFSDTPYIALISTSALDDVWYVKSRSTTAVSFGKAGWLSGGACYIATGRWK